jgi:ParB family chromosome partitioning protein
MSKVLGKGLSALIPEKSIDGEAVQIVQLDVARIRYNHLQPRSRYAQASLDELKASIRDQGILQPILVRANQDGDYEVVAGERRLRAVQELQMAQIPAIVKDLTDQEALVIALVENIQREQLNPIEEAEAFQKLISEFSYTQESVALAVGKDRSTITNFIRLLRLPDLVKAAVSGGDITVGHARALLGLERESEQIELLDRIVKKSLSVREVEKLVKRYHSGSPWKADAPKAKAPDIMAVEDGLQKILGTKVGIERKGQGDSGRISIDFYSDEDLNRIVKVIIR